MARPFVIFFHIERAGGTSLHNWFMERLPGYYTLHSWYYWANEPEHSILPGELRSLARFTPGMQGVGAHTLKPWFDYEGALGRKTFDITVLREPRSRFLSHFNHQRLVKGIPWTIEEFSRESRFSDFQTVRLAGGPDVEVALDVVDRLDAVGFTDQYDRFLSAVATALCLRPHDPAAASRFNRLDRDATVAYDELTTAQKGLVDEANRGDLDLYERARRSRRKVLLDDATSGAGPTAVPVRPVLELLATRPPIGDDSPACVGDERGAPRPPPEPPAVPARRRGPGAGG